MLLTHADPEPLATCPGCGEDIYVDDEVVELDGIVVHDRSSCLEWLVKEWLGVVVVKATPQLFDAIEGR